MNKSEVENKGIDEKFFFDLCNIFKNIPTLQTFGINLIYLGHGVVGIKMKAEREYTTINGRLHGGIIATLADTAMGWAILSQGNDSVTLDMSLNYFAPVYEGSDITAESCIIFAGKTTVVAEANMFSQGKLVAKSRGTFFLAPNKVLSVPDTNS